MAGDFNMTPEQLHSGAGDWVRAMRATIARPAGITCRSGSGGRVIDFCVLDARLAGALESIAVDWDFPSSPHFPVRIRMRGGAAKDLVSVIRSPADFGTDKPIGCERKPRAIPLEVVGLLSDLETVQGMEHKAGIETTCRHSALRRGNELCSKG